MQQNKRAFNLIKIFPFSWITLKTNVFKWILLLVLKGKLMKTRIRDKKELYIFQLFHIKFFQIKSQMFPGTFLKK